MEKELLNLDLQMFAENEADSSENTGSQDESSTAFNEQQQEKVNRLIAQAKSKAKDEAEADKQRAIEEAVKEAVEKEREIAKLNGKELEEYKQKEAEKKYQAEIAKRDEELEQLKRENLKRTIRDEAYNKLSELKLPNIPESIQLLESDSLEEMAEKADLLASYTTHIKNMYAKSNPPLGSGGLTTGDRQSPADIFRNANILNKKEK